MGSLMLKHQAIVRHQSSFPTCSRAPGTRGVSPARPLPAKLGCAVNLVLPHPPSPSPPAGKGGRLLPLPAGGEGRHSRVGGVPGWGQTGASSSLNADTDCRSPPEPRIARHDVSPYHPAAGARRAVAAVL